MKMPLPEALPGLVFRYEYVWKSQALAGRTTAEKDRPACIVLAVTGQKGDQRVLIVPMTTKSPPEEVEAIEIPPKIKRHLGLGDDRRSWIILSEANIDGWPSPDMRQLPGKPGEFAHGLLPLKMVNKIRVTLLASLASKRLRLVTRDP